MGRSRARTTCCSVTPHRPPHRDGPAWDPAPPHADEDDNGASRAGRVDGRDAGRSAPLRDSQVVRPGRVAERRRLLETRTRSPTPRPLPAGVDDFHGRAEARGAHGPARTGRGQPAIGSMRRRRIPRLGAAGGGA